MDERSDGRAFVGRASELARLVGGVRDAIDGRPAAMLLAGEAGVGKSRLIGEVERLARELGARVVEGACLPRGEAGPPLLPIVSMLRSLAREVPPATLPGILGPGRSELARLVPEFAERADHRPPAADPADPTAQARLFDLVVGTLDRVARAEPLLLVIEDVHWADRTTRDLVDFLIRGLRDQRMLVVLSIRTDELEASDELRSWSAEVVRLPGVERLDLGPLDRADVELLVGGILGRRPHPVFVDAVSARANGNPYLVEELVATGDDGDPGAMPSHLREVLLARLVGLDDVSRAVLRAASAAGTQVDDALLCDALDVPPAVLTAALRAAVERGVLVRSEDGPGAGYAFRHALLRDAIHDDLFPTERARLHGAYAAVLTRRAELDPDAVTSSTLSYHWDAAGVAEQALAAHVRAGREASRMFAFAESRAHDERALELWDRVPDPVAASGIDRIELLERAADAASLDGDHVAALHRIREAIDVTRDLDEPMRLASLRERERFLLWEAGDAASAAAAVAEALRLIPEAPPSRERARALAHAAGLELFADRPRQALATARTAKQLARAVSALPEEALALGVEGMAMATLGRIDDGIAAYREGMAIARLIGSIDGIALAYTNLASILDRVGRTREALQTALEGFDEVSRSGLARSVGGFLLAQAGRLQVQLGAWQEADRLLRRGLDLGPVPRAQLALWIQVGRLEALRGQADAATAALEEAAARATIPGADEQRAALLEARLGAAIWSGRLDAARTVVDEALAIPTVGRMPDETLAWIGALGLRVEADVAETARARRDEVALGLAEARADAIVGWLRGWLPSAEPEVQERLARSIDARAGGMVALLRAEHDRLIGHADPTPWRSVVAAWQHLDRPLILAYGRLRLGTVLLAAGQRDEARTALAAARSGALSIGAEPLLRELERLARVARLDLEAVDAKGIAAGATGAAAGAGEASDLGLTPREAEVLRLVAAGWSNPQIAEALGISGKTVSVHVSNLLGKLGVSSRVEAAVIASRIGAGPASSMRSGGSMADQPGTGPAAPTSLDGGSARRMHRTFVFTDVVGSAALTEAIGDAAWRDLRRWHDATLRASFARHGGREIDHPGDGFFVVFERAADAVACATSIQRELADHRRTAGFAPAVRIGLHTGDATPEGGGFAGTAVTVAARVAARAEGGEVLASEGAIHEARVAPAGRLVEVHLPGVSDPVAVAPLAW